MATKARSNKEQLAEEAERRRHLEGNTLFKDLGEPIQKILLQVSSAKDISDEELALLTKVTVKQLAKIYDLLALEEDPEKILAWLKKQARRNMEPEEPVKPKKKINTGASGDPIGFFKDLEQKNIAIVEQYKQAQIEREQQRQTNLEERRKRRAEMAAKKAAEAERLKSLGLGGEDKPRELRKKEIAEIGGVFDRFTKKSDFDNTNSTQDTEWWKQDEFRRDFEKNGKRGKLWSRVIEGGSKPVPESEAAIREEWYKSQVWWKSDKFRRDWLASRDAEWWKEEMYIKDFQKNGENGAMWTACDEISGYNRKGASRRAPKAVLADRVKWYENNGPKGIVKMWCSLSEGSGDRCTLEEKLEREDYYKNGDWWKSDTHRMKFLQKGQLSDATARAGCAGEDREWWKEDCYRQDFLKGGSKWRQMTEKSAVKGEDAEATEAEKQIREDWFTDYWWKAEKYIEDFEKNGMKGSLWKAKSEEEANSNAPKPCREAEGHARIMWYESCRDREWWKDEVYIEDYQQNGDKGTKWTQAWKDAPADERPDEETLARRRKYFEENWWKSSRNIKDFQKNGTKGTIWKTSNKDATMDMDWWKQDEFVNEWTSARKAAAKQFWKEPAAIADFLENGHTGKKWTAAHAAAASVDRGAEEPATAEQLAEREQYYQENWWKAPEYVKDWQVNKANGALWTLNDLSASDWATPKQMQERQAYYQSQIRVGGKKWAPKFEAALELDATKERCAHPADAETIRMREEHFKKNWWNTPQILEDYQQHGMKSELLRAASADVIAEHRSGEPKFQCSEEEAAARAQKFDEILADPAAAAAAVDWWQDDEYRKEFVANQDPAFWKRPEAVEDFVQNGKGGKVWTAANASVAAIEKGDAHPASAEQLEDREKWLQANFWRAKSCQEDFRVNGDKGTLWTARQPGGQGGIADEAELHAREIHFKPNQKWMNATEAEVAKVDPHAVCSAAESKAREEWFENNWWKAEDIRKDWEKHGKGSKLFRAVTPEAAALGLADGSNPAYEASPEEIAKREEYFEACGDLEWWKDPSVIADWKAAGKEGAQWQARNATEAGKSMGQESPATAAELQDREEWYKKNFWKTPEAIEDWKKNGEAGAIWASGSLEGGAPATDEEKVHRRKWLERHAPIDDAEAKKRKEWLSNQLSDAEKVMRRQWMERRSDEVKKINKDELADVLTALNDGVRPTEDQVQVIEECVKRRRRDRFGEGHADEVEDLTHISQEEFIVAVAESDFYIPSTEEEYQRQEEEEYEALQREEMKRQEEEAAYLALEAEEEAARAAEEGLTADAAAEEAEYLAQMEAEEAAKAHVNEEDVALSAADEAAWEEFVTAEAGEPELTEEQMAELDRQEAERKEAEMAVREVDEEAWKSTELEDAVYEEEAEEAEEDEGPAAGLTAEEKEQLEAAMLEEQEEMEGWGADEEWEEEDLEEEPEAEEVEEPEEEVPEEEVDEMFAEEKGVPQQWKLPLPQVVNPQYLKSYFTVIKYTPSHSLLGGKQKRIWVVDHFTRCFYNLEKSGKIRKEHAANKLLQLERNVQDSNRLRLMFFDAAHSYELQFFNASERERFYETASAIRPSIRVYAPALTNPDENVEATTTTVDGVAHNSVTVTCRNYQGKPVPRELNGECKINASKLLTEPVTVWCGTFNLAGNHPPKKAADLAEWMPKDKYDIYAIAVQEAAYRRDDSEWFDYITTYLGRDYLTLASMNLWDTLLIVLTRKKNLLKITNVEGSTKATVHKAVCGTKGGIGISMRFLETSMCFVTCHLAARLERNAMRNTNIEEICEGLQLGIRETDFTNQFNHVFFFGDFNYRVEMDNATANELIEQQSWEELLEFDQMTTQRNNEGTLYGFTEPFVTFAPTYRMQVGTGKYMAEKGNSPSYCDRVLTRSMPNTWVKCTGYKAATGITCSEHTPVAASFILRCVRPAIACCHHIQSPIPNFVLEEVRMTDSKSVVIKKPGLIVQTPFSAVPVAKECNVQNTTEPSWLASDLAPIESVTQLQEYLETCHILLIVRDLAEKREEKAHRGTACIPLFGRVLNQQDQRQAFESDILYKGRTIGKFTGTMHWEPRPLSTQDF